MAGLENDFLDDVQGSRRVAFHSNVENLLPVGERTDPPNLEVVMKRPCEDELSRC